jgi:hypothetical protein
MVPLSVTTQTAYAELLEQLLAIDARRSIGDVPGTFVTKEIKGTTYVYFQYSAPGGAVRQAYIGRKSRALDVVVARFAEERTSARADEDRLEELAAMLRAGGALVTDAASTRILAALSHSGIFRLGAVLVGTHAFVVLGNVLGIRWAGASSRTEDVDIAVARVLQVAVPNASADVPRVLEGLEMGFLPVPAFSPKEPSTSFKVRGRGMRVDLLTPSPAKRGAGRERPVPIPRLHAAAAPLRHLDYVLEDAQPAAVVGATGVLVTVPHPARFGIHKLVVAQQRATAFATKSDKDIAQAVLVLEAVRDLRPGDLRGAWRAAKARGKAWERALRTAIPSVARRSRSLADHLERLG